MKTAGVKAAFVIVLSFAACAFAQPSIWPWPQSVNYGSTVLGVQSSTFKIVAPSNAPSILTTAISRYTNLLFLFDAATEEPLPGLTYLNTLTISITSTTTDLQFGIDESYTLSVNGAAATLSAPNSFGAIRGLETFSQIVNWDYSSDTYSISYTPITISDAPRFAWRGLLVDTSRHYLSVNAILRTIDALAYNKFNTLHWHAVDAESFPIESVTYPLLSEKGAYAPQAVYTAKDIQSIVQYGLERGVRVVPEFDMPGHAASWGQGYPEMTADCPAYAANINNIAMDPTQNFTYQVIQGFLAEVMQYFPDSFLHLGGDEVVFGCWTNDPAINTWMQKNHMSTTELEQYFETNIQNIVDGLNKTKVCWQELFNNGINQPMDTVVEVWMDEATLSEVVSAGFRGLVAFPWYLDKQIPDPPSTHYEWVDTWKDFYAYDPYDGVSKNLELIIGGEACMWGEQVDSTNIDSRVWPRASAVGERLWSPVGSNNVTEAITRLVNFRCLMAQRGIGAGPIAPDYCPLPFANKFA